MPETTMPETTMPETDEEGLLAEAIFVADYPNDKWSRFKRGDVVDERYRNLARAAAAHLRSRSEPNARDPDA